MATEEERAKLWRQNQRAIARKQAEHDRKLRGNTAARRELDGRFAAVRDYQRDHGQVCDDLDDVGAS